MRAVAGAAIAAGCLMVLASGCTATSSDPAVPTARTTSAAPADTASAKPAAPQGTVAEFAPCTAAQLAGRPGGTDFFMGTDLQFLVLTNTSQHPCTLSGPPTAAAGTGRYSISRALRIAADMDSPLAGPLVNLRPGQSAEADVISANQGDCARPTSTEYTAIGIGIGHSGMTRVAFPAGRPLRVYSCASPVYVGGFGVLPA
jgi:hypothetical protein